MDTSDEGDEYEVQAILADAVEDGKKFYLVKWQGYDDEECTWEPAENFASQTSIKEWEYRKAKGDGLPDDFLTALQARMDAFQEKQREQSSQLHASDDSEPEGDIESSTKVHDSDTSKPLIRARTPSETQPLQTEVVRKRKGTAVPANTSQSANKSVKYSHLQPLISTARKGRPLGSKNDKTKARVNQGGQMYRNLSHQNNARKKQRAEPPPMLSTSQLKSVGDFDIGPDTAHFLPSRAVATNEPAEYPLFFADTSGDDGRGRQQSPIPEDGSPFPPTKAEHARKPISDPIGNKTTGPSHAEVRKEGEPYIPYANLPHESLLITRSNGRSWYIGDIICDLTMGRPVGATRIIHLSMDPYGDQLIDLKPKYSNLTLNLHPSAFTVSEFEAAFTNFNYSWLARGLLDPFEDQQQAFTEFAQYLEEHNSAALFDHPALDFSLIFYSYDARSWKRYGQLRARPGSSRPRLHVLARTKLIPHQANQHEARGIPDSSHRNQSRSHTLDAIPQLNQHVHMQMDQTPASVQRPSLSLVVPRASSLSGQLIESPSIAHSVSQLAISTTTTSSPHEHMTDVDFSAPNSPRTDVDLQSRSVSPVVSDPMSPSHSLSAGADGQPRKSSNVDSVSAKPSERSKHTSHRDNLRSNQSINLNIDSLTGTALHASKLERKQPPRFFISFPQSQLQDVQHLQRWLEKHTPAINIYQSSEPLGWDRFRADAETRTSTLLFNPDSLDFRRLPELGKILASPVPVAFSVTFGKDTESDLTLRTTIKPMFFQGTMYLMTESSILQHPQHALEVVNYFGINKGPNYRLFLRPNIEQWLLGQATDEKDEKRRYTLLDILVSIRKLRVGNAVPLAVEEEESSMMQDGRHPTKYIISPETLPGYMDDFKSDDQKQALQQREKILFDYFFSYAAVRAHKFRRFWALVSSEQYETVQDSIARKIADDNLDCGHIYFRDVERFAKKFGGPSKRGSETKHK